MAHRFYTLAVTAAVSTCIALNPASAQDKAAATVPAGACHDGHDGPVLQLKLQSLKKREGQFRIELYPDDEDLFLEGKAKLYRYYTPVPDDEEALICVTAPAYGNYGLIVIHDMNMNSKTDFLQDGFGLSTNPKMSLRRPKLDEARFTVDKPETVLEIDIQYVSGNKGKRCRGRRC